MLGKIKNVLRINGKMNKKSTWEESVFYEKTNNNIFYHMFCINDALERFERTYKKIVVSGLINNIDCIYINCVGPKKLLFSQSIQDKYRVRINLGQHHKDESETLNKLREFCIDNTYGNVLYLHSKGSSKPKCEYRKLWKECMEYFLVEEYEKCLNILCEFDSCGVELKASTKIRNRDILNGEQIKIINIDKKKIITSWYAGNFWWAKNSYISKLDPCGISNRYDAEFRFLFPHLGNYNNLYSLPDNKQFHRDLIHRSLYAKS